MLVLTRKYQEKIRIGNNITITVLRTKGKAVRLGIEAPSDVPVIRGELSFENEVEPNTDKISVAFDTIEAPKRARAAGANAKWATESQSTAVATAREPKVKVGLTRVPRNKVAAILPTLVRRSAPLRPMMEERASR